MIMIALLAYFDKATSTPVPENTFTAYVTPVDFFIEESPFDIPQSSSDAQLDEVIDDVNIVRPQLKTKVKANANEITHISSDLSDSPFSNGRPVEESPESQKASVSLKRLRRDIDLVSSELVQSTAEKLISGDLVYGFLTSQSSSHNQVEKEIEKNGDVEKLNPTSQTFIDISLNRERSEMELAHSTVSNSSIHSEENNSTTSTVTNDSPLESIENDKETSNKETNSTISSDDESSQQVTQSLISTETINDESFSERTISDTLANQMSITESTATEETEPQEGLSTTLEEITQSLETSPRPTETTKTSTMTTEVQVSEPPQTSELLVEPTKASEDLEISSDSLTTEQTTDEKSKSKDQNSDNDNFCTSEACVKAGKTLERTIEHEPRLHQNLNKF